MLADFKDLINLIYQPLVLDLVVIFSLNAVSTTLSNLKTVFLSKDINKPVYITTFIDSIIFVYAVRLVAETSGMEYVVAFAAGRLFGVFLGNWIENKLSFGLLEVVLYKHPEDGIQLADELRTKGFSVTTTVGYGMEGKERLVLNIVTPRSLFTSLQSVLEQHGKVNMSVKPISSVYGKIASENITIE